MAVPCGPGGVVHDYVPLYFGSLSPMLLGVINKKNVDQFEILYFEYPITLLDREDVVYTDASANTNDPPSFYDDPTNLDKLNWTEIDSLKWSSQTEQLRHERMAEVLVRSSLPIQDALRIVVWNGDVKKHILELAVKFGANVPPITFEDPSRRHWFKDFLETGRKSVVTGPRGIALQYGAAVASLQKQRGRLDAPFASLRELLTGLRHRFDIMSHTAELVGLQSENGIHQASVDVHTLEVVARLRGQREFAALADNERDVLELAAYLHDIGKGPKSRWVKNNGVQKVDPDHPVRAMPMMVDILTASVQNWSVEDAKLLLKLVCYHDLVGEVLGKGRDEAQLVETAADLRELDMLFALGKADATSLVEWWWNEDEAQALYDRCYRRIANQNPR